MPLFLFALRVLCPRLTFSPPVQGQTSQHSPPLCHFLSARPLPMPVDHVPPLSQVAHAGNTPPGPRMSSRAELARDGPNLSLALSPFAPLQSSKTVKKNFTLKNFFKAKHKNVTMNEPNVQDGSDSPIPTIPRGRSEGGVGEGPGSQRPSSPAWAALALGNPRVPSLSSHLSTASIRAALPREGGVSEASLQPPPLPGRPAPIPQS